jgi:hypothetical protein
MVYKTIYDIEIDKRVYFTKIFKTEEYEKVFLFVFNQTDIPDEYFNLFETNQVTLQIFGLWYWLVKSDKTTAKKYFLKAIEAGNYNAYLSLANTADTKDEKLTYLLCAYTHNIQNAAGNLGVYYMEEKSDELAIKYFTEAVEKGEPNAMSNFGAWYLERGDEPNAIKYFTMGAENGYHMGYLNLMLLYSRAKNTKLFNKYNFYVNIYLPQYMYNIYNKIEPKDDKIIKTLAEYKNLLSQMYVGNSNILMGDYIGKEKMEEFANKVSNGQNIKEQISNGKWTLNFEYRITPDNPQSKNPII